MIAATTERSVFEFRHDAVESVGRFTRLEGRAVPYNTWANVGPYLEQFKPGAFAKSIRETAAALPLMLFHGRDDLWPIGLATRWQSKDDGLYGSWQLNDSPNAQRAAAMAKSGELGFLSIGFVDVRSVPELAGDYNPDLGEDHMDRITRIEARLVETSIVPTPAYADAQVTLVRDYRRKVAQSRLHAYRQVWQAERANLPG
jgi:HK97 family phage prohead protease